MAKKLSPKADRKEEPPFENPFDGEPVKGRVFTREEVKERMKFFGALFGISDDKD
jgi:hypothetical protein